ncbi:single hybrid motif-containing protein [Phlebopus sp. FC_14]|nr:single hybrid motif-containing protein [Phlebopus sp. FC_14]
MSTVDMFDCSLGLVASPLFLTVRFRCAVKSSSASSLKVERAMQAAALRQSGVRIVFHRRCLHRTGARYAITNLEMPAMSPTMTEGGIASWKKKEGESFAAGEVLLEIETDKATIDVEAQDDGVVGKIIVPDGTKNVSVGRVIALLAEEGDDISNLEAPKEVAKQGPKPETSTSAPSPPPTPPKPEPVQESKHHSYHPTHSKHLLPSVIRLLIEANITNAEAIKGTGVRGMLTKGDVLAYLGKASSPTGTYKAPKNETASPQKVEPVKPLDGTTIRKLIISGLVAQTKPAPYVSSLPASFDSIIADYIPPSKPSATKTSIASASPSKSRDNATGYLDGLV